MPRVSDMIGRHPITPTTGMWEAMDEDMKAYLSEIAANVRVLLGRGRADDAYDEIQSYKLETENYAALWTRFDSAERRLLRAVGECRKEIL